MKVLLRADAGISQGTGHVMRCLTLAEELRARGHSVALMGHVSEIEWLKEHVHSIGLKLHSCPPNSLNMSEIRRLDPDWVVVDSYEISASEISELNRVTRCLAIVDGGARSIEATLYLDQNLGAEDDAWARKFPERVLAGSEYCLVREDVVKRRRRIPWRITSDPPTITVFLGGTDPEGTIVNVARSLMGLDLHAQMVLICPPKFQSRLHDATRDQRDISIMMPTIELPRVLSQSDVIVSAAGTSAWDVCTLGIPAVLIATVENQQPSLRRAEQAGLALGIDSRANGKAALGAVGDLVGQLLTDSQLREEMSTRCRSLFDGQGKARVAEAMERKL